VVVTELVRTGPAVILVSSEKGAAAEVRLPAEALSEAMTIARVGGQLAVTSKSGLAARVVVSDGATPLFRAMRLRRSIAGRPRLRWRASGSVADPAVDMPTLTPVTWDEFVGNS
jgi:hypothetical protein